MRTGMANRSVWGHLQNVAPAAFVQMIAIERETCALEVRADGRHGILSFVAGELCDAELDGLRGEAAAILVLGWDRAAIETRALSAPPPRSINAPLTFILLESMRRRDETSHAAATRAGAGAVAGAGAEADAGAGDGGRPETSIETLVRELDGVRGAIVLDLASGAPLAVCHAAGETFDAAPLCEAVRGLADAELALRTATGRRSALEEIVLTFADLLVVVRLVRPEVLLAVIADPARVGIAALHLALHRLVPALAEEGSTWRG